MTYTKMWQEYNLEINDIKPNQALYSYEVAPKT